MLVESTRHHHIVVAPDDEKQSQPTGWTGELTLECLADLLQLLCMARATGALHVRDARERPGCVWFDEGAIVHASASGKRGAEALYELLTWHSGTFLLDRTAQPVRYSIEPSVTQRVREGAFGHAREHSLEPPAAWNDPPTGTWNEPPDRVRERAATAFERGLEKVRAKDYAGALETWERVLELEPGNRLVQSNLRRLRAVMARAQAIGGEDGDEE